MYRVRLYLIEVIAKVASWLPINLRFLFLSILILYFLVFILTQLTISYSKYQIDNIFNLINNTSCANDSKILFEKKAEINITGNVDIITNIIIIS